MIRISYELGRNISMVRKRAGLTQTQLAQMLTQATGETISMHMVSSWQRGIVDIPASIMPSLCHCVHCSSYELYPHSETLTDRDVQLIATIKAMGEDEKEDLFYLLHMWRGDRKALLKLDVIHAVQSKDLRYGQDRLIIKSYKDAIKRNDPRIDRRITTDLNYVERASRHLLDEDE